MTKLRPSLRFCEYRALTEDIAGLHKVKTNRVLRGCGAEDVEIYHDKTGLALGRKALVEGIKNNICGRETRELGAVSDDE